MAEFQGREDDSQTSNLESEFSRFSGLPRRDSRTTGAPGPAYGTYLVMNIYEETPPPNSNPFTNSGIKVGQVRADFLFAIVLSIYIHIYIYLRITSKTLKSP